MRILFLVILTIVALVLKAHVIDNPLMADEIRWGVFAGVMLTATYLLFGKKKAKAKAEAA